MPQHLYPPLVFSPRWLVRACALFTSQLCTSRTCFLRVALLCGHTVPKCRTCY